MLILDIGNGIDEVFQLLDLCKRIYMPVCSDGLSECKIIQFENLLRVLDYPQVLAKTVRMKLPFHESISGNGAYVEQLPWSQLGEYVKELIRKENI